MQSAKFEELVPQDDVAKAVNLSSENQAETQSSASQADRTGTQSGDEAGEWFCFDELVSELLQSSPKGNADKMRVLRFMLKFLSASLLPANIFESQDTQVCSPP